MKWKKVCDIQLFPSSKLIGSTTMSCSKVAGKTISPEKKLSWVRSQLIGDNDVNLQTPFGRRRLTYADHTATGRSLLCIENFILQQVLPFYGNTHTTDSFVGQKTTRMVEEAAEYIKTCLRAGPTDAVIFCGSGATAAIKRLQEVMGIAVAGNLRERIVLAEDGERWVVFVGPWEHHSNLLSWGQTTAQVVEIGVDRRNGLPDMEALEIELDRMKRTDRRMLGSFSACSNVTGVICDTRAIARLLHQYGAFACFDFATSGPYVEIDMASEDSSERYDAIFLSPHKFVGGVGSPGILIMNKALYGLKHSPPSTCGGGVVEYVNGFNPNDTIYNDNIEEREDAGTPPIIQKIRAALAFKVKELVGYELIDLKESFYIEAAIKRFLPNPAIHILGNLELKRLAVLSFLIFPPNTTTHSSSDSNKSLLAAKPLSGRFVAKLLNDLFGIQARGGCSCAGPYGHHLLAVDESFSHDIRSHIEKGYKGMKPGWTRVSFAYYMSKFEFEFILSAIEFIATYGHRFLSIYAFDWATGHWSYDMTLSMSDYSCGMMEKLVEGRGFWGGGKVTKRCSALEFSYVPPSVHGQDSALRAWTGSALSARTRTRTMSLEQAAQYAPRSARALRRSLKLGDFSIYVREKRWHVTLSLSLSHPQEL